MRMLNFLWNIEDIVNSLGLNKDDYLVPNYREPKEARGSNPTMSNFFSKFCGLKNYDETGLAQYDVILDTLIKKLFNRWLNNSCIYLVASEHNELTIYDIYPQMRKILDKIDYTVPVYARFIADKQKYLEEIKSTVDTTITAESRHNDTPNANSDYSANEYTSDISKSTSTSSTDIDPVERYKQVHDLIENVYRNWLNEFKEFEIWMD